MGTLASWSPADALLPERCYRRAAAGLRRVRTVRITQALERCRTRKMTQHG